VQKIENKRSKIMFRIINKTEKKQEIIKMTDMPYNSVAEIVNDNEYNGHYVFMVHDRCYFNLTNGTYWSCGNNNFVKLLHQDEKIIVEFFNNE
jgi:hypothetical protein